MKSKIKILIILFVFVSILVAASAWMYQKYVVPNSKFHTELKGR